MLIFKPFMSKNTYSAKVVDLFCGVGGLTHGFVKESFNVVAGYDIDESCEFAYEENNQAKFFKREISTVTGQEILSHFGDANVKILVGCSPCQPFSTYSYKHQDENKYSLLNQFARLIEEVQPDIVSMENVPRLAEFDKEPIFTKFLQTLESNHYKNPWWGIVNCPDYGIPQNRKRLVLLASKHGEIELIPNTHTRKNYVTVEDTIKDLEPLESGQVSEKDFLHRASKLSPLNLKRVKQSKQGGSWKEDWDESLWLECHKKDSGKNYVSVYGRMKWSEPAPTMTTHCTGIGNGRFGHPEQDRAITLREASLFQTFPPDYKFADSSNFNVKTISTHIGNSVPVMLGQVIAKSIKQHLEKIFNKNDGD